MSTKNKKPKAPKDLTNKEIEIALNKAAREVLHSEGLNWHFDPVSESWWSGSNGFNYEAFQNGTLLIHLEAGDYLHVWGGYTLKDSKKAAEQHYSYIKGLLDLVINKDK